MRKLVLSALLIAGFTCAFAQKVDDIKEKVDKQKWGEAKEKVDKFLADAKNQSNADAWYYKAQIYNELAKTNPADTTLMSAAYDAMNRFVTVDFAKPEDKRAFMPKLTNYRVLFEIYSNFFRTGAEAFQAKEYNKAFNNFERAVASFNVLSANKLVDVPFDTTSVLYAGVAAESAKMPEAAAKYYQQIVDKKIKDTTHIGIYGYLATHYKEKGDMEAAARYIDMGESLFPERDVWTVYRIDMMGKDTAARLKRYEELIAKSPNNAILTHDYAVEMYRYVYMDDKRVNDTAWLSRLKEAFRQSLRVSPTPTNAYILTTILNDDVSYLQNNVNRIRGTAAADVKRKKDMQAQLDKANEEMIRYALQTYELYNAMPSLKAGDKANFKKTLQNIVDYYKDKGQADKAAPYEAKIKTL